VEKIYNVLFGGHFSRGCLKDLTSAFVVTYSYFKKTFFGSSVLPELGKGSRLQKHVTSLVLTSFKFQHPPPHKQRKSFHKRVY
jgi:hypothetical protein